MKSQLEVLLPEDPQLVLKLDFIRHVRNSVMLNMTGNNQFIGYTQQQKWFDTLDHDNFKVFLFWVDDYPVGHPAGYGIVRQEGGRVLLTGALVEEFRGKGYGRQLFTLLTRFAIKRWGSASLDVLATNKPALSLYKSLGFVETRKEVDADREIICMTLI